MSTLWCFLWLWLADFRMPSNVRRKILPELRDSYCERYTYNRVDDLRFGKSCKILDRRSGFALSWEATKEYLPYVSNLLFSVGLLFPVSCGRYSISTTENLFWNRALPIAPSTLAARLELVCALNTATAKLTTLNKIVFHPLHHLYYSIGNSLIVKLLGWEILR